MRTDVLGPKQLRPRFEFREDFFYGLNVTPFRLNHIWFVHRKTLANCFNNECDAEVNFAYRIRIVIDKPNHLQLSNARKE